MKTFSVLFKFHSLFLQMTSKFLVGWIWNMEQTVYYHVRPFLLSISGRFCKPKALPSLRVLYVVHHNFLIFRCLNSFKFLLFLNYQAWILWIPPDNPNFETSPLAYFNFYQHFQAQESVSHLKNFWTSFNFIMPCSNQFHSERYPPSPWDNFAIPAS